uniref:Wzz domain-containing protein n=1 Tax=Steinernema glaseri TaxID=37863 RepID=A0A1I8AKS0_9BILA
MDLLSDTKKNWNFDKFYLVSLLVIVILPPIVSFTGTYTFFSYMTYEDTSKPHDTNAYLDKAFSSYERHLSYFNFELREWIRGEDRRISQRSRESESEILNGIVADAQSFQRKLSGVEDRNDVKDMVILALKKNGSRKAALTEALAQIDLQIDELKKQIYAEYQKHNVSTLDKTLIKVAELMKQTHTEHHEHIDTFWSDLKRNTTPGILNTCLPVNSSAEIIAEEYRTMVEQRVSSCVPIGEKKFVYHNKDVAIYTVLGAFILVMAMLPVIVICYACFFDKDS